jgi:Restriction endonuclease
VNMNSSAAGMMNTLTEAIGIKVGVVIEPDELAVILDRSHPAEETERWWRRAPESWVRIRPEELEQLMVAAMYAIGALPDSLTPIQLLIRFAYAHPELVDEMEARSDESDYPFPVTPLMRFIWHAQERIERHHGEGGLETLMDDYQRRSLLDLLQRRTALDWDGVTRLRELFHLEELGGDTSASFESAPLIDQRFINYMQAQPQDLTRIHWRQFEFLVGEYFRRSGYQVVVTPPSGDGGIDVRASRTDTVVGPEMIIVQAKRLGVGRQVGIDAVKALWADVNDSTATRGLIVTTTGLAKGAKTFCEARQYRLTAAERPTVDDWLAKLATYPR